MYKLFKKSLLILAVLLICQLALAGSHDKQKANNANQLIAGTWSSVCAPDDDGNYIIETFIFSANSANYSINTYRDAYCKQQLSKLTTYRNFILGDKVPNLVNTYKLDYVFNKVTMAFTDSRAVTMANKSKSYGFSNWVINQARNVSGMKRDKTASAEHAVGEKFYTIVQIQKNKLYMGDYASGTGTSAKERLSSIYNIPFLKVGKP